MGLLAPPQSHNTIRSKFKYFLATIFVALVASFILSPANASAADTYSWVSQEVITATVAPVGQDSDLLLYGPNRGSTVGFFQVSRTGGDANKYTATIRDGSGCNSVLTITVGGSKGSGSVRAESATCTGGGGALGPGKTISISNVSAATRTEAEVRQECTAQQLPYNEATGTCGGRGNPNDENNEAAAEEEPPVTCENSAEPAALRYVLCAAVDAMLASLGLMDTYIESLLDFDVKGFEESPARNAWESFRILAYSLIFIAGLVIVIGQAASGVQFLDAYTIKKAIPRLLIAVVFISISWELLLFATTFINDIGKWIQDILLEPFESANTVNLTKLLQGGAAVGGTAAVGGAIGVVYLVTLGPIGALTLLLTGVAALLIGLAVLSVRTMLITLALIVAPLAIACMILPATQKVWDLWRKTLTTALLIFPLIMMLLAAGKIAAGITTNGVMAVLFYLAPFFLIPFTFRLAGGLVGRIANLTNDKTRGLFDRGKKFREEQYGLNRQEAIEGKTRLGKSAIGGFHRRAHLARQGGFMPGKANQERYQQAAAGLMAQSSAKALEDSGGRLGDDDALDIASDTSTTRSNFLTRYAQQYKQSAFERENKAAAAEGRTSRYSSVNDVDATEANNAAIKARAQVETMLGGQVGTQHIQATAARGWLASATATDTGTAEGDMSLIRQKVTKLVHSGAMTRDDAIAAVKSNRGRADTASAGFGDWIPELDREVANLQAGGTVDTGVSAADIRLSTAAINGARPSDIAMGNKRGAINYGKVMTKRLDKNKGNEREFMTELAAAAGMYDTMANVNPVNARELRDTLTTQTIDIGGKKERIVDLIEANRSNGEFIALRREYSSRLQADMASRGAAGPEEGQ